MSPDLRHNLSTVWARYTDLIVECGSGAYLYTTDGRRLLDFSSGIGVTNTGHCHPAVVAAAQAQVAKLIHGQINVVYHQPVLDLTRELLSVMPPGLDNFFFSNSGAEAVEAALKLARQASGRPGIIVFQGGFHGRTIGAISLTTSNALHRTGYQPLMAGVFVAPYPNAYRYGWTPEEASDFCLQELRYLMLTQASPEETGAVLIEPVQGEGGYVPLPRGFLEGVRQICDENQLLLIIDEIQTGFGRTGTWFGHQHFDVIPDIMIMAKGLASGFPLSAIATRKEIMQRWRPGYHGGTFGGNAVSCAASAATIRTIRDEGLVENSAQMGAYLKEQLASLQTQYPVIGDVRGLGLMVGVEFTSAAGQPDAKTTKEVRLQCLDRDLLLLTCGPHSNVIRWIPPLIVTQDQIDEALNIFRDALAAVVVG